MGGVIHPLHQVDLLTPAERKITEKEYWAQRRGQETLDKLNQKMLEDGITPKETRYQTEKQFLRDAIDDAASTAQSPEEFSKISYHLQDQQKPIQLSSSRQKKIYHWTKSRNTI